MKQEYKVLYEGSTTAPVELDYLFAFQMLKNLRKKLDTVPVDLTEFHAELASYVRAYYQSQLMNEEVIGIGESVKQVLSGSDKDVINYYFANNTGGVDILPKFLKDIYECNVDNLAEKLADKQINDLVLKMVANSDTIRSLNCNFIIKGEIKNILISCPNKKELTIKVGDVSIKYDDINSIKINGNKADFFDAILAAIEVDVSNKSDLMNLLLQISSANGVVGRASGPVDILNVKLGSNRTVSANVIKNSEFVYMIDIKNRSIVVNQNGSFICEIDNKDATKEKFIVCTQSVVLPKGYGIDSEILPLTSHLKFEYDATGLATLDVSLQANLKEAFKLVQPIGRVEIFSGVINNPEETDFAYPLKLVQKFKSDIANNRFKFANFQNEVARYLRINKPFEDYSELSDEDVIKKLLPEGTEKSTQYLDYLAKVYYFLEKNHTNPEVKLPDPDAASNIVAKNMYGNTFRGPYIEFTKDDGAKVKVQIKYPAKGGKFKVTLGSETIEVEEADAVAEFAKKAGIDINKALFILNQLASPEGLKKTTDILSQKVLKESNGVVSILPTSIYRVDLKRDILEVETSINLTVNNNDTFYESNNVMKFTQRVKIPAELTSEHEYLAAVSDEVIAVALDPLELQLFAEKTGLPELVEPFANVEFYEEHVESVSNNVLGKKIFDETFEVPAQESNFYALNLLLDAKAKIAGGEFNEQDFKDAVRAYFDADYLLVKQKTLNEDEEFLKYFSDCAGYNNYVAELLKFYNSPDKKKFNFDTIEKQLVLHKDFEKDLHRFAGKTVIKVIDKKGNPRTLKIHGDEKNKKWTIILVEPTSGETKEYVFNDQSSSFDQIKLISEELGTNYRNLLYIIREMSFQKQPAKNEIQKYHDALFLNDVQLFDTGENENTNYQYKLNLVDNTLEISFNQGIKSVTQSIIPKAFHFRMKFFYPNFDDEVISLPEVRNAKLQIAVYKGPDLESDMDKLVGKDNSAKMKTNQYWKEFFEKAFSGRKKVETVAVGGKPEVQVNSEVKSESESFFTKAWKIIKEKIIKPTVAFFNSVGVKSYNVINEAVLKVKNWFSDIKFFKQKDVVPVVGAVNNGVPANKPKVIENPLAITKDEAIQGCRDAKTYEEFTKAIEGAKKKSVLKEVDMQGSTFGNFEVYNYRTFDYGFVKYTFTEQNKKVTLEVEVANDFSGIIRPQFLYNDGSKDVYSEAIEFKDGNKVDTSFSEMNKAAAFEVCKVGNLVPTTYVNGPNAVGKPKGTSKGK